MRSKLRTNSDKETFEIGENFGRSLKGGEVILLNGDLGAGKTVFAKGIAKGLGVDAIVNSPTFTIMNEYLGSVRFCHFDMYRIDDESELRELGFEEVIGDKNTVCAIEWASKTPSVIPSSAINVYISKISNDEREIEIK